MSETQSFHAVKQQPAVNVCMGRAGCGLWAVGCGLLWAKPSSELGRVVCADVNTSNSTSPQTDRAPPSTSLRSHQAKLRAR